MISKEAGDVITDVFKNRWRTLMSVDDLIADVITTCEELGIMNYTYFFYSSDHGFQLGQFNIPMDKRHVYDWNSRVHLLARGPGIKPGSRWDKPATQVDLAPTFLGLAGLSAPPTFDGKSIAPFLITGEQPELDEDEEGEEAPSFKQDVPRPTAAHLNRLGGARLYAKTWRDAVFLEYYFVDQNIKCMDTSAAVKGGYPEKDAACGVLTSGSNHDCWKSVLPVIHLAHNCYATESDANNFIALRSMNGSEFGDILYVEYQTGSQVKENVDFDAVDFVEYFNVSEDTWMLRNLYDNSNKSPPQLHGVLGQMHERLHSWLRCAGSACP